MSSKFRPFVLSVLAVLGLIAGGAVSPAFAQMTDTCDPEFWKKLQDKAYMEAQRQQQINASIVTKPDSVLQLTCFDTLVGNTGQTVGSNFSDGFDSVNKNNNLQNALDGTVSPALQNYLSNYDTAKGDGSNTNGAYNCNQMEAVWKQSKCTDVATTQFASLEDINSADPRDNVDETDCSKTGQFDENQFGDKGALENVKDNEKVFDDLVSYFGITDAVGGGGAGAPANCSDPIPTGVKVKTAENPDGYDEGICPNPGCTFVVEGGAGTCKKL